VSSEPAASKQGTSRLLQVEAMIWEEQLLVADMEADGQILTSIHKALIGFNKRAERVSDEILEATFVDSAPLYDLLSTNNNQVIYGRRGTGKTHALKYLAQNVEKHGDHPIYIDLRSIGSNGSIYNDGSRPLAERASTLVIDVLNAMYDELYSVALEAIENAPHSEQITLRLDEFAAAIQTVRISGTTEQEDQTNIAKSGRRSTDVSGSVAQMPALSLKHGAESAESTGISQRTKRTGTPMVHLNFGNIGVGLNSLIAILGAPRLWLLIDEWSEIPAELQPYLADLLRRTVLPISKVTLKIAAIEHRSNFRILKGGGDYVGVELGADVAADLNLDDFLVFDNNQVKSTAFFKTLLFRHYKSSPEWRHEVAEADTLVQLAFTQFPVFEEFIRAVEGVPRDALNLAAKIATKAFGQKIAMAHVRNAARDWYQQDKQAIIRGNEALDALLAKVIDDIIGQRKARAFLFPSNVRDSRIERLFDSRLLHVLKKNISSRDEPGTRYDVYKIDYGCYVDLVNTSQAPRGLFETEDGLFVEVPRDDYRSIRRAILRPEDID
jgi:hypothetical protein